MGEMLFIVMVTSECRCLGPWLLELGAPRKVPAHRRWQTPRLALRRYLSWDDYFMAVAFLSAQRSKDPHKQVCWCFVGRGEGGGIRHAAASLGKAGGWWGACMPAAGGHTGGQPEEP